MDSLLVTKERDAEALSEVYLLVAKFLRDGPCKKTFQVFAQELDQQKLLPHRYDVCGNRHSQSLNDLDKKYPHVTSDTIIQICERLRRVQEESLPHSIASVSSFLGGGRYSLLRGRNKQIAAPPSRIFTRLHGCPLQESASPSFHSIVRTLDAQRVSGPVSRKHLVWPKLYSRLQLLKQTLGHVNAIYCVLFDQTGRFIFTGADDLVVKVWSTHSARLLVTLRGASSEITDLAVNVENTLVAASSLDRVCYVWCLQTTCLVARLAAPVGMITGVNFCPTACGDFRYLASTSSDGSVVFWVYTHQPIGKETVFLGHPVQFNEKMRPGVAQMICSAFSPGGTFLAAGSADHHVRVYLMPGDEGPRRIMEEEAHSDRVDSIQWANRHLRFVSGSKDGFALVWSFRSQKWTCFRLDISTELPGDTNVEPQDVQRQKPRVSMVCWDQSDQWIITAQHDASLKVWNSETGKLLRVVRKHRRDVFVLEPHSLDAGIMLSAGHDALLCVWDIRDGTCLYQYKNLLEGLGLGAFYDAKWSPDGTIIVATDCYGHILLFGFGAVSSLLKMVPREMFFNTDYWPIIRDEERGIIDETSDQLPHLMAAPYLVNSDGTPYSAEIQRLVPGRELEFSFQENIAEDDNPSYIRRNVAIPSYFRSTEQIAANRTVNGFINTFMLPLLSPSTLEQIRGRIDAIGNEEILEYEKEKRRPPEPSKILPIDNKPKPKKKRVKRSQYQTRAAVDGNEFLNPESLDLSLSSTHSDDSSSALSVESESDSNSGTEYSDWIADHGVSLEPPKRSRRRRAPRRLSPSEDYQRTRRKTRENRDEVKTEGETAEKQSASDRSISPKIELRLEDVPQEYLPPKWLSEVVPRKAPYYPQMGDEVMFFQQGYQYYLEAVKKAQIYKPSTQNSFSKFGLTDPIAAKVIGIKYEIRPPRLCCLRLAVLLGSGRMTSDYFNIKFHDMPDVIDFLVLRHTYDIAMERQWKPGDRFRCMIDDSWWLGSIINPENDNPVSSFLSLSTLWDNGEGEAMSPWDLEPVDQRRLPAESGGSIDVLPQETLGLLYSPRVDEWPNGDRDGTCDSIIAGIEKVMTLAIAEPFSAPVDINLYPLYAKTVEYPMDLSTIKARLENRFYRRLIAVQFDVRYLATNAEKFNDVHSQIVKHARIVTDLCLRIIKDQREDVVAVYHQLADAYQSSSEEEDAKSSQSDSFDWRGDCDRLLRELVAHPDSAPFRQPVDLVEFPDYLQSVERPMDLGTVREELMAGNYSSPREFYEDMRQIFANSRAYNTNKRSRIFSMSIRLSHLFEARLKQLTAEWKASRRRRIHQSAQTRKKRLKAKEPQPGTSREFVVQETSSRFSAGQSTEPQPSTSGVSSPSMRLQPLRITLLRRHSPEPPISVAVDNSSSSDDDTNLSTLRHNYLKKPGSEDDQLRVGRMESVNGDSMGKFSDDDRQKVITLPIEHNIVNDNGSLDNDISTSSDGDNQVLATLRTNSLRPNEINGHSYAKRSHSTEDNGLNASEEHEDDETESNEDEENSDETDNRKVSSQRQNGRQQSSSTDSAPEDENSDNSDWKQARTSGSDTFSDEESIPRRSLRSTRTQQPQTRGRIKQEQELGSRPARENGRRKKGRSSSSPRRRTRRRRYVSSDSEPSPPRRRKRQRSSSESSGLRSSSSEKPRITRRRLTDGHGQRNRSASEDSEPLMNAMVSSRGRVRTLTEKAKAAFGRRN